VVLLTLVVCPFVFAVPSALITVDLATLYPLDGLASLMVLSVRHARSAGGMVSWIDIAFGGVIGTHNMYWFVIPCVLSRLMWPRVWFSYIIDSAVYPAMAGQLRTPP
jgi:hypothetical protein